MTTSPPSPAAPQQRLATVARPAGRATSPVRTPAQQAPRASAMVRNQQLGERLFAIRLWMEFHVQLGNLPATTRLNALTAECEQQLQLHGVRDYTPFELYEAYQQQPKPQFTREAYDMIQKEPNLVVLDLLEDDEIPQQGAGENPPPLFRKCEMH